jgi:hypothetical protein
MKITIGILFIATACINIGIHIASNKEDKLQVIGAWFCAILWAISATFL